MTSQDLSLDNLSLQFLENGPIRQIAEVEFDLALDRLEREQGIRLEPIQVREAYDVVLPQALIEVLDGRQSLVPREGSYIFTTRAQRDLCDSIERQILTFARTPAPSNSSGMCPCCHPLFSVLPLSPIFRSMVRKIHRFLFP